MLKKLVMKVLGKKVSEKLNLKDEPATVPTPGQEVVSIPWYQSKAKIGFLVAIVATGLKYGPQLFNQPAIEIPEEILNLLREMGIAVGGYGLRDAIKKPL